MTKMAERRGLAPLARKHALVSTEARHARPVDIPFVKSDKNWIGVRYRESIDVVAAPAYEQPLTLLSPHKRGGDNGLG
jgi:hypothetical protein